MSDRVNVKQAASAPLSGKKTGLAGASRTAAEREEFILEHRALALGLARRILRRWGAFLPADEIVSGADFALCEAAAKYVPQEGASFATYLFYFVKGQMFRLLASARGDIGEESRKPQEEGDTLKRVALEAPELADDEFGADGSHGAASPDEATYRGELRKLCAQALASLAPVESEVIVASRVGEEDMVGLAKRLGYSRGYLFAMRKAAERRLRLRLQALSGEDALAA